MAEGNSSLSPVFLKARTEEELQKLILLVQVKDSRQYKFISIYRSNDYVYAWYYKESKIIGLINGQ